MCVIVATIEFSCFEFDLFVSSVFSPRDAVAIAIIFHFCAKNFFATGITMQFGRCVHTHVQSCVSCMT